MFPGRVRLAGRQITIDALAKALSRILQAEVEGLSGLAGTYDLLLYFDYQPVGSADSPAQNDLARPSRQPDEEFPRLGVAIQRQLGLELKRQRLSSDVLVIDQVNRSPTDN
jgi:uncharacterized protein (TIGR03435 family)